MHDLLTAQTMHNHYPHLFVKLSDSMPTNRHIFAFILFMDKQVFAGL